MDESLRRKKTCIVLEYSPKVLINYKGKDNNFTVEKCSHSAITKWSRSTSPVMRHTGHMDTMKPLIGCIPWYSWPQKSITPCISTIKNIRQVQIKGHSIKQLVSTLQKCQGHERQEYRGTVHNNKLVL